MRKPTGPFRFKQFSVLQEKAAMKVGFDGILLGAWTKTPGSRRVLDIGTGTGLIALMLAQRSDDRTQIDAIDIAPSAASEAAINFANSPWSGRLSSECVSLQQYEKITVQRYDAFVCNPPYYGGEKSRDREKANARHLDSLSLFELMRASKHLATDSASLSLILPTNLANTCRRVAQEEDWRLARQLQVRPIPEKPVHRVLFEFRRSEPGIPFPLATEELTIEEEHHRYTPEFRALARDFYLAF